MPVLHSVNFANASDLSPLVGVCRETPIVKWVNAGITPGSHDKHQPSQRLWELSVTNGQMTLLRPVPPPTIKPSLFFTNYRCGSSVQLSAPVRLTFSLDSVSGFSQIQFWLQSSPEGANAEGHVRFQVGSAGWQRVPEGSLGTIDYQETVDVGLSASAHSLIIESARPEFNLIQLSRVPR